MIECVTQPVADESERRRSRARKVYFRTSDHLRRNVRSRGLTAPPLLPPEATTVSRGHACVKRRVFGRRRTDAVRLSGALVPRTSRLTGSPCGSNVAAWARGDPDPGNDPGAGRCIGTGRCRLPRAPRLRRVSGRVAARESPRLRAGGRPVRSRPAGQAACGRTDHRPAAGVQRRPLRRALPRRRKRGRSGGRRCRAAPSDRRSRPDRLALPCTGRRARHHARVGRAQADRFFGRWTAKEAYTKALGTGLSTPLESFDLPSPVDGVAWFTAGGRGWTLWQFEPWPGYTAAVVASGRRPPTALHLRVGDGVEPH